MEALKMGRVICLMTLLFLTRASDLLASSQNDPFYFIRAISIDPRRSETVYAAVENQGLIKSTDGGAHWKLINKGIRSYLAYDVKASLKTPGKVYAATWGGGFYLSHDEGESWEEGNMKLGNTAVGSIVLTRDGKVGEEHIYIETSTDVFELSGEKSSWKSLGDGLAFWNGPQFQGFVLADSGSAALYLGTEYGLFKKTLGESGWKKVEAMKEKRITALLYHPRSDALYAGTLASGGIFISRDHGKSWSRSGEGLEKVWIRCLAANPSDARIVYAATTGEGVLKSSDEGATWVKINSGLDDLDVRTLAVDPQEPSVLFAGTHGAGIFKSTDGGNTWKVLKGIPFKQLNRQLADIDAGSTGGRRLLHPPASFRKCNQCHGWTDKILNQKKSYWRVAATGRTWKKTVSRMSEGTDISPEEQEEITTFLEKFTGEADEKKPPPSPP